MTRPAPFLFIEPARDITDDLCLIPRILIPAAASLND